MDKCANDAYISVTGHFISTEWNLVSCVLGTYPFPGHHTVVLIAEKLEEVFKDYDLTLERDVALVHNQASNMELSG